MIEQWLLNVNNCEQWLLTTVVDRVQQNIVEQCAAQHCNKLLTTLITLFIFARVVWIPVGGLMVQSSDIAFSYCCYVPQNKPLSILVYCTMDYHLFYVKKMRITAEFEWENLIRLSLVIAFHNQGK